MNNTIFEAPPHLETLAQFVRHGGFPHGLSWSRVRIWTSGLALCVALFLGVTMTTAQTTAVCSDTPTSSQRIECTEDSTSGNAIDIDAQGVDIDTTELDEPAIKATHAGNADIDIGVTHKIVNQAAIIHSNLDTTGNRGHGIQAKHTGDGTIDITTAEQVEITTMGANAAGIAAEHTGATGDVFINATGTIIRTEGTSADGINVKTDTPGRIVLNTYLTNINTQGEIASGIWIRHSGATGNVTVTAQKDVIETRGRNAHGIYAEKRLGSGNVNIYFRNVDLTGSGVDASKLVAVHAGTAGDIRIESLPSSTSSLFKLTGGENSDDRNAGRAIRARNQATGNTLIDVANITINALGREDVGIEGRVSGDGITDINVRNARMTFENNMGIGIYARNEKTDSTIDGINLDVDVKDTTIITKGYRSWGVFATNRTPGSTRIELNNVRIETQGTDPDPDLNDTYSYALAAYHRGAGGQSIDVDGTSTIMTQGSKSHGIVAYHFGSGDSRSMDITVGGTIETRGVDALGVRVGTLTDGSPDRVAPIGQDGYRQQTVTVNGSVMGGTGPNGAGVFLAGGGRVIIGRRGSIGATSGIAILATGTVPKPDPNPDNVEAILPKLRVDLNLGGRRVAQALGNNWILNDGGETTIAVNGVVLHDGATGVTGRRASNGAWNVRMRAAGVTVTDRTDPANWMVSEPAAGVVADRDFSAQDFNERRKLPPSCPAGQVGTPPNCMPPPPPSCPAGQVGTPPNCMPPPPPSCPEGQVGTPPNCMPPPPPSCPEGQVGTPPHCTIPPLPSCPNGQVGIPPNCTEPEPEQPMFMEEYAPRAAVYEALPDFLLRLTGPNRNCRSTPDEPVWVRFAGGQGSYEADRSTTGATYTLDRFETEGGLSASLTDRVRGWVSVRHIWGTAGIGSPTGGGEIDVRGLGSSVGGAWQSPTGAYALGCFAYMAYNVDFASSQRGLLKAGTDGQAYTLDFETGWRFGLFEQVHLTPRVWVVGSRVNVDSFTDTEDARVSYADADRVRGRLGFLTDTTRSWGEGALTLRGSVDVERLLSGRETRVEVSGEPLSAIATEHSLLVGLNGIYRQGRFSIGAEVAARQELGSDDSEYAGFLNFGVRF